MMRMLGPHQAIRLETTAHRVGRRPRTSHPQENVRVQQAAAVAGTVPDVPSDVAYEQQQGW